jgi:hypothetical protein
MLTAFNRGSWRKALVVSAAVVTGLVGTVVLAGPASAHATALNTPTSVCDTATGTYTITYTGQGDYNLTSTVAVTNSTPAATTIAPMTQTVAPVKVKGGGYIDPYTIVQTGVPGSAKSASITISETWTDNYKLTDSATASNLGGNCAKAKTPIAATAPSFTNDTCVNYAPAGSGYTIPATTGVIYKINGKTVNTGTYTATDGTTVIVTAVAAEGYTLTGPSTFSHTFGHQPTCTTTATAGSPTFTDDHCVSYAPTGSGYTIPATTGVIYKINGQTVDAGTYTAADGTTVIVAAVAAPGYTLSGTATFTHTFTAAPTCTTSVSAVAPDFTNDACGENYAANGASFTIPTTTGVSYKIDGKMVKAGTYSAPDGLTVTVTAVAGWGYTLTGDSAFTHTFGDQPTCTEATDVARPTFADDSCTSTAGATYTIPSSTGVNFVVGESTVAAGTYSATDGSTMTITAVAAPGYTLTGDTTFTHTFAAKPICTTAVVPASNVDGGAVASTPVQLAFTGTSTSVGSSVALGAVFLAFGGLLIFAGRRKRNTD